MPDPVHPHTPIAELVAGRAWVQAMLEVEAALTSALAGMGQVPPESAARIVRACDARGHDLDQLAAADADRTLVSGVVTALRDRVPEGDRSYVHVGASAQDIADTALMLVAKRALAPLLATCQAAAWTIFELAQAHRHTPMVVRTMPPQPSAVTFGLRAAIWLDGIET